MSFSQKSLGEAQQIVLVGQEEFNKMPGEMPYLLRSISKQTWFHRTGLHEMEEVRAVMKQYWGMPDPLWYCTMEKHWDERDMEMQEIDDIVERIMHKRSLGRFVPQSEIHFWQNPVRYINVWVVNRQYGGPEEGGWWYDAGDLQASIPCLPEQAAALEREVREAYGHLDDGRPLSSVLSRGSLQIEVSDEPGEDFPSQRPHYE